jgi:hypothetical protein
MGDKNDIEKIRIFDVLADRDHADCRSTCAG